MKWILIGHRGVGKSQLLKRMQTYFNDSKMHFFDLDDEIAKQYGKSISHIFQELGEQQFRMMEKMTFDGIVSQHANFILAAGAGFQLKSIPENCKVLWVRRKSDKMGRIFFNRPRLNKELSALDEYFERYVLRQENYASRADLQYLMPEGIESPHSAEEQTLKLLMGEKPFPNVGGILTILPHHLKEPGFSHILNFSVDYFELRDDLLSADNIENLVSFFPTQKILLSFRKKQTDPKLIALTKTGIMWDWAQELGDCPFGNPSIISLHEFFPDDLANKKFPKESHLKISPIIEDFAQLKIILNWQQEDAKNRSILPRSQDADNAKWIWVRLWLKGSQKLNFFKIDDGSAGDQPSLYQWLNQEPNTKQFAAVLGQPVSHSHTPIEQQEFFKTLNCPVYAIDISPEEFKEAFQYLDQLGLIASAVTAPLKNLAAARADINSDKVEKFNSANTLWKQDGWQAENTDLYGFQKLIDQNPMPPNASIAIWGGGGTLPVIAEILPQAVTYSVRSGEMRDNNIDSQEFIKQKLEGPEVLIWAAGADAQPPLHHWKPRMVIDLNYREDSLAREYALEVNALYVDGLAMFKAQAEEQRRFWSKK